MTRLPVYCAGANNWGAKIRDAGTAVASFTAIGEVAQVVKQRARKMGKNLKIGPVNAANRGLPKVFIISFSNLAPSHFNSFCPFVTTTVFTNRTYFR